MDKATTGDIISNISSVTKAFDNKYKEIHRILDAEKSSSSSIPPKKSPWEEEKDKFDEYMRTQYESLNNRHKQLLQHHSESVQTILSKERLRINSIINKTTVTAVDQIDTSSKSQSDPLTYISTDTINSYTEVCHKFQAGLNVKSESVFKNITAKVHQAEISSIKSNKNEWMQLESQMKKRRA